MKEREGEIPDLKLQAQVQYYLFTRYKVTALTHDEYLNLEEGKNRKKQEKKRWIQWKEEK